MPSSTPHKAAAACRLVGRAGCLSTEVLQLAQRSQRPVAAPPCALSMVARVACRRQSPELRALGRRRLEQ
eukprot:1808575-Heterocapsa_arctica.AAC.1